MSISIRLVHGHMGYTTYDELATQYSMIELCAVSCRAQAQATQTVLLTPYMTKRRPYVLGMVQFCPLNIVQYTDPLYLKSISNFLLHVCFLFLKKVIATTGKLIFTRSPQNHNSLSYKKKKLGLMIIFSPGLKPENHCTIFSRGW